MRCSYRRPFMREDWMRAAYAKGPLDPFDTVQAAAQCVLPESSHVESHDKMPHMVINPWTHVVHAYWDGE